MESEPFTADSVFAAVKGGNVYAKYHDGTIPSGEELESPYTFSQSRVVNGKDILVSVTVPEDASELYISIADPHASYFNVQMEDDSQNVEAGYFVFNTDDIQTDGDEEADFGLSNYLLVISTAEGITIDGYDVVISYKSPDGISRVQRIPMEALTLTPLQKQLRVGFYPPSTDSYTLTVQAPNGKEVRYIYDSFSGGGTFDNSESPKSTLTYDADLGINWIDLDPVFGHYAVTFQTTVEADYGDYIYIELMMIINAAGQIEELLPDLEIM